MRVLALLLVALAIARAASAEPPAPPARPAVTIEAILPGCRSLLATEGVPTTAAAGFCGGLIDGLLYLGAMIPADFCFVVPANVPHHRVVAAIVAEIEPIYASVKLQHFKGLAIDVLEYKWPCQVQPKVLTRE
jgi:hypothetical protein